MCRVSQNLFTIVLLTSIPSVAAAATPGRYTGADAADWWPTAMALSRDDQRLYVVGNWPSAILIGFLEPSGNGMTSSRVDQHRGRFVGGLAA